MRMIVAFAKTPQVRYLGHLDLMRFMQRALRKSGLPIRYSQGFNPHVVLSFASPLPVGASGAEELMDVGLEAPVAEDTFLQALAAAMPPSLPVLSVRAVSDAHPKLMARLHTAAWEAYVTDGAAAQALAAAVPALLSRDAISAIRKTKRGEREVDIRPMLYALSADGDRLFFRTALTEAATLKPSLLIETLAAQAGIVPPPVLISRIRLYAQQDGAPVPLMLL